MRIKPQKKRKGSKGTTKSFGLRLPKIIFKYSRIYDEFLSKEVPTKKTIKRVLKYMKRLEKSWKKDEEKVLKEISKITSLKWREKEIHCYIVRKAASLSDPLTLRIYNLQEKVRKIDFLIDILTHELIHRIFTQEGNFQKTEKAWGYIDRKYKKESERTKTHIVIHAIHTHIYLKLYDKERLKRDIQWASYRKDYKRAWEIIQRDSYQKIIGEFTKRIK